VIGVKIGRGTFLAEGGEKIPQVLMWNTKNVCSGRGCLGKRKREAFQTPTSRNETAVGISLRALKKE